MTNDVPQEKAKSAVIRAEFDRILMRHVSSLIDTREDIAALPFNLATISSLLLLADRENEIKSFPDSPPERYNRETFLADMEEIGLDLDEDVILAIQNLEHYGFVMINSHSQYAARESASLLIMVLDAIFPQMPGMNLVAYVSQAIEEVRTGRKEEEKALLSFDQTLMKQGVRLSAIPENGLASSAARRILAHDAPDPEVLRARRSAYLDKLKALRAKSLTSDATPSVVSGGAQLKHVKIRELFPKADGMAEPAADPEASFPSDAASFPSDVDEDSAPGIAEAEPAPTEFPEEAMSDSGPDEMPPMETVSEAPGAADMDAGAETEPRTETADLQDAPSEEAVMHPEDTADTEDLVEDSLSKEDLIEQQIRQFEEELAMPCPICGTGKVLSDTTEKGKTYYHCSNEDCRLISWGKPYHLPCPVCKNPFLIEVPGADGEIGLKCPRATCMYRKKSVAEALSDETGAPGKRKVAVVKKKVKKGVRRVVRRKG